MASNKTAFDCPSCIHREICPAYEVTQVECENYRPHCKDCKYWESIHYEYRTDGFCRCLAKYHDAERPMTEGDHYCAYGKSKEKEK